MKLSKDNLNQIQKAIEDSLTEVYRIKVVTEKQKEFFELAIKKIKEQVQ